MTYREAYDKIIDAYFKDEIKPFDAEFCFCGTLNNNDEEWKWNSPIRQLDYSSDEFFKMESALFSRFVNIGLEMTGRFEATNNLIGWLSVLAHPEYEEALFAGMSAALDVLKQIHIERGEIIDEVPVFTKRKIHA